MQFDFKYIKDQYYCKSTRNTVLVKDTNVGFGLSVNIIVLWPCKKRIKGSGNYLIVSVVISINIDII